MSEPTLSKEKIGPSGLSSKRITELIQATGLKHNPLFSTREMVRRVIDGLITSGELRVTREEGNGEASVSNKLSIKIDTNTFHDNPSAEIVNVLRWLADKIESNPIKSCQDAPEAYPDQWWYNLYNRDGNGDYCGYCTIYQQKKPE
jgi:hypothetical protein